MTNKKLLEQGNDALKGRTDYERKLAQFQLQRFGQNRGRVNNHPFPRASNVIYPLSDTLIDQKKPFLFKLLYSSETVAHFKALIAQNVPLASMAEKYFDFVIREQTDFEEEIQYAIDGHLQDGECYIKTTWDVDRQVPEFEYIEPMFVITPSGTLKLQDAEWIYHILQLTPGEVKSRFKDVKGIEKFVEKWSNNDKTLSGDAYQKEDNEYSREGINKSGSKDDNMIVLWECHYMDKDRKMIKTISPDDEAFDFEDEHEYPYEYPKSYRIKWMIEQGRREFTNKKLHSARGIPELVQEGEYSLTAMWRAKHNAMTYYNNPIYHAPNGITGSTQNITFKPGALMPFAVQAVQQGQPPISWDIEMQNTLRVWEKRASSPDAALSKQGNLGDSRTAKEVSVIANQQDLSVQVEAGNWKMFIRRVLRQAWSLIVQHKPESLAYFADNQTAELNMEALNPDYSIVVSGSAEALNKELELQKADMLLQRSAGNQYSNFGEAWKNFLQAFKPGEVQRFYQDPASRQQQLAKKVASDISLMMTLGFPVQPDQMDDQLVVIRTLLQFVQAAMQKGQVIPQDVKALFGGYVGAAKQILSQTNKPGVKEADQMIQALGQMLSAPVTNAIPMQQQMA